MVCHYCAIKKLNGTVQTTKEMKILLKRGLWSHKTGHISNTIYDRKLKFGIQVKDFITYMTTISRALSVSNFISTGRGLKIGRPVTIQNKPKS
jgi:hypothetical protein